MSGLVKAKKYDWKDSNMELVGSDEDRAVKKEAAKHEPMWQGAGQSPGLQIWRIEKFQVKDWPKKDYGRFYDGDSYVILNTYTKNDKLLYDVHFWIGKNSTADEYGTAAYKTVELDTLLDDIPVQHRECQGHESKLFLSYFQRLEILKGGVATGFKEVAPEQYKPRLLLFHGTGKKITVKQIPISKDLNTTDVFLLDMGIQIIQWNGKESNMFERNKASMYCQSIKGERSGKSSSEVIDEDDDDSKTIDMYLTKCRENDGDEDDDDNDDDIDDSQMDIPRTKKLFKLSDASGELEMDMIAETDGRLNKSDLNSADVFLIDTGTECIIWIGRRASSREKSNGIPYAHNYLKTTSHPLISVTCLKDGAENDSFWSVFSKSE